jgi:hypothetical protein
MKKALKDRLLRVWQYILARAQESSTWRGVVLLGSVAGAKLEPERAEALVLLGLALAGLIAVLFADARKEP